ncbi:MAG: hypothetical protein PVI92_06645 [Chromatiales bacterium]
MNIDTGGEELAIVKNENGARLAIPVEFRVITQAIGRGMTVLASHL